MGVTAIVGEIHRSIGSTKGAAARRRFKTNQTATHVETGAYAHQDRGSTPLASTSLISKEVTHGKGAGKTQGKTMTLITLTAGRGTG